MKNIITVLTFLILFNILIFANLLLYRYNNLNFVPVSFAKNYNHNDNYNLVLSILKDTNKNNLIPYIDYIELEKITTIPNDTKSKIAFKLSLPQQVSFIAFYDKKDTNKYEFQSCVDNLSSINHFYFYNDFLVVEQTDCSNSSKRNFFEVFFYKNNKYASVFNKNIYNEKIIKEKASDNIIKEIETSSIDFVDGTVPKILCISTITKYKSYYPFGKEEEFMEIKKTTKKVVYQWNNNNKTFIVLKSNS